MLYRLDAPRDERGRVRVHGGQRWVCVRCVFCARAGGRAEGRGEPMGRGRRDEAEGDVVWMRCTCIGGREAPVSGGLGKGGTMERGTAERRDVDEGKCRRWTLGERGRKNEERRRRWETSGERGSWRLGPPQISSLRYRRRLSVVGADARSSARWG
ncbi:hypothetical protein B0H12DRAFT_546304 [Mycena haematopus]|nr:hypothetical protein B0H12DRAFT_546304 [Mycena haematopus]